MTSTQQGNNRKRLPIGILSFRRLRQSDCYYVDKTLLIQKLIDQGDHYFLSRPRRFGKSLLLDTLHELFDCQEELFRGLAIHDHWDWSQKHPVVRISFGAQYNDPGDIERSTLNQLSINEHEAGLSPGSDADAGPERLQDLLYRLHHLTGKQVVVLVDDYDMPILDMLDDEEAAKRNRDYLSGLYGIIKDSARDVRFVLITGVSMLPNASIFSGLNNLDNISLNPQYATICGYMEGDLDQYFAPELPGLDREEIHRRYSGYNWLGEEKVYNPQDVLELFGNRQFGSYWYQTGLLPFVYRTMARDLASSMKLDIGKMTTMGLKRFDVENIELRSLMFQSGYLTIGEKQHQGGSPVYTLEYPNLEVQENFNTGFLSYIGLDEVQAVSNGRGLLKHFASNNFDRLEELLRTIYHAIPNKWYHNRNAITECEGLYLSVLYLHLKAAGSDVRGEMSSSRRGVDLVLKHAGQVFVMEAKVVEDESEENVESTLDDAMKQINGRSYGDQYRGRYTAIHVIAIVFGKKARNLVGFKVEAG